MRPLLRQDPGKAFLLAACLISASILPADGQERRGDELLVVDCLLPPQVRQLGRRVTYLSARKATRTTARDCQIRGGEYVAYDRASLQSSLQVWLPLAESGDAEAQTIVGEIYEKGIGGQSDYASAARWYRMAAAQGDVRAQIGLGYLLEHGLGTAPNPAEAANWYSRAAGSDQPVELDPEVFRIDDPNQHEDSGELAALRDEVQTLTAQAEQMRAQLEMTRASLEVARTQMQMTESELTDLQRRTAAEAQARERPVAQVPVQNPVAVEPSLLVLRDELLERNREMAELSALLADTRAILSARSDELGARDAQIAAQAAALERADAQRQELERLAQNLAASEAEMQRQRQEIQALESGLAASSSDAASGAEKLTALQATLAESEAHAAARRSDMAQLQTSLANSESDAASLDINLAQVEAELTERESELAAERDNAVRLQAELEQLGSDAHRLQRDLAQQRAAQAIKDRVLVGPTIAMIEPEFGGTRGIVVVSSVENAVVGVAPDVRTRQIIGRVTAPAGLLAVTINEKNVQPNPAGVFSADIALDSLPKKVSVVAVDQQGKRADVAFEMRSTVTEAENESSFEQELREIAFGNYYALIIGNNAYEGLPDLQTAIDDARDLERVLSQRYGFHTRLLLNANRYEILSALNDLREQLTSDDNLLIFYAGHGELDETNMRGHWLPVDAESDSSANWLSNVAITDILNVMNARQILVIADSCYSGALTRSSIAKLMGGMTEAERLNWLQTMAEKRSRMVLSSGGLAPVLDAGGGKHSVFTSALLQVLESNQELIEGQRLYQAVAARVAYQAANMQFDQVPEYAPIRFAGHESGDFFFVPVL